LYIIVVIFNASAAVQQPLRLFVIIIYCFFVVLLWWLFFIIQNLNFYFFHFVWIMILRFRFIWPCRILLIDEIRLILDAADFEQCIYICLLISSWCEISIIIFRIVGVIFLINLIIIFCDWFFQYFYVLLLITIIFNLFIWTWLVLCFFQYTLGNYFLYFIFLKLLISLFRGHYLFTILL
jgi:hypothetical protein